MLSVAVLISGGGSNLQAIVDLLSNESIDAHIVRVISNRPGVKGLERAEHANIPTEVIDHTDYDTREDFDQALIQSLDAVQSDLIVLAGFMRILTPRFVEHFSGRMINIHPSLLPAYKGLDTHRRALADGVAFHGASVHFVTPELDAGAVILQGRVPVYAEDDAAALQQRVHRIEHIIYPEVIRWFAAGRIGYEGNHTLLDGARLKTAPIIDLAKPE